MCLGAAAVGEGAGAVRWVHAVLAAEPAARPARELMHAWAAGRQNIADHMTGERCRT